jgi:hypothetical protein
MESVILMVSKAPLWLAQRQRYRLREAAGRKSFVACPEWFEDDGVYEGDIDPSSQEYRELRIRLFNPRDGELTFLVEEGCLEEVD